MRDKEDTDNPTRTEGPPPTTFSDLMATVSGGEFDAEVTKELRAAIEASVESGGSAVLNIKLVIKKENRMVVFKPTHKATLPKKAVDADMFFVDENGRLTKDDPKQTKLRFTGKGSGRVIDISKKPPSDDGKKGE